VIASISTFTSNLLTTGSGTTKVAFLSADGLLFEVSEIPALLQDFREEFLLGLRARGNGPGP
jgi:hypothetical protein